MNQKIEQERGELTNLPPSPESDPTEGALLCLKIRDRYLVSVRIETEAEPEKPQCAVVTPITGLSKELIPLLYPHIPDINLRSFQSMYRGRSDTQTPVYDIHIPDSQIAEKIEGIVAEGKSGLALLTENQLRFQQGYDQFQKSSGNIQRDQGRASEIKPLCLDAWGMSLEAPVHPLCLGLLTPHVSAEPSFLPEGLATDIFESLKSAVYSVETKDEENQYRLGEKDLKVLRKHCLDPKSVDDLEKLLVIRRAIVLALKGIRSAAESGIIVSSQNKAQDTFTWGLKLGVAALLLISNGAVNAVDDLNVKSVNEALSSILHHLVPLYQQDDRVYGLSGKFKRKYVIDKQTDKSGLLSKAGDLVSTKIIDPTARTYQNWLQKFGFGGQEKRKKIYSANVRPVPENSMNTQLHDWAGLMAYKIAQAEEIAPFTVEMLSSQVATDIPLLANRDILPIGLNLGLMGTTWGVIRMAFSSNGEEKNKIRRSLSSKMIASAIADIVPILASMASVFIPEDQLGLMTTSAALTANHAAKQMGGTDEMDDGREALKDLRELLMHFDLTLVSDEAREEHGLRIMSTEDAGLVYEENNRFKSPSENPVIFDPRGKKERRFALLDEAEARKYNYESVQPYTGKESISARVHPTPRVPALLMKDFTARMGETTFLDRANLYLPSSIYELNSGPRTGKSIILKSLADIYEHPEGTLLLGQEDTDFNIHGEGDKNLIGYFDCAGEIYDFLPDFFRMDEQDAEKYQEAWVRSVESKKTTYIETIADNYSNDKEKAGAVVAFLKETGMFEDEEIVRYLSHDKLDQFLRSRLWVASAGLSKSPVLLLDDPFVADTFGRGIYKYYEEIEEILKKMNTQEPADANELEHIRQILNNIKEFSGYVRLDEKADIIEQIESIYRAFQPVVRTCDYLSNLYWYQKRIIIISSSNSPETEGFHGVLRAKGKVLAGTYTIRNHQLELLPEAD